MGRVREKGIRQRRQGVRNDEWPETSKGSLEKDLRKLSCKWFGSSKPTSVTVYMRGQEKIKASSASSTGSRAIGRGLIVW